MEEIVYHKNFEVEDTYWWFTARNLILENIIKKECNIKSNDDILDVGCGTGGVMKYLSNNYNMLGLDFSPIALDYCRKRGLTRLYNCTLENFPKNETKIKAITFFDVIEHIEDDFNVVKTAWSLLPQGGYIVASVPAYMFLWSMHDVMHQHKRRYTINSFSKLFLENGFSIQYTSYFNTFLMLPAVLKRFLEKVTGMSKKEEEPVDKVPPIINKIFHRIFAFERFLIPGIKLPFGLSIILVAKKI